MLNENFDYEYESAIIQNLTALFISQESEVLSIIRHRGAPRRSLGNYEKNGSRSNRPQTKSVQSQIGPIFVAYYCQHAKLNSLNTIQQNI